jgi:DNA integrity scanning protein DisA with diadenylate cyclase activity
VLVLTLLIAAHLLQMELIRSVALFAGLVLVVVFQPEVRRAFVMLGSTRFFSTSRENLALVEAVTEAASQLAAKRCGALLAFERGMDLDQFVETGVEMDSKFTPELVLTIFHPKTALHDGGMVLRQGRIAAAGCGCAARSAAAAASCWAAKALRASARRRRAASTSVARSLARVVRGSRAMVERFRRTSVSGT